MKKPEEIDVVKKCGEKISGQMGKHNIASKREFNNII